MTASFWKTLPVRTFSSRLEISLIKYILRRLLLLPVIMFFVTLILFFLLLQLPLEQRAMLYMPSTKPNISPEELAHLRKLVIEKRGLDKPFPVQYVNWLRNLVRGEWGYSPAWRQDVLLGILQRAPATLELSLAAMIPSLILALLLGPLAARYRRRLPDQLIRSLASIGWAFPSFILGLFLMNVFYAWLHWFPPERVSIWAGPIVSTESFRSYTGLYTVDALLNGELGLFMDALRHLVLPSITLVASECALFTRILRVSTLEVLRQDYITTARAKGLPEGRVMNLHARRNALLPLISTGGVAVSALISGVVLVELVFNFNGLGRSAVKAILASDIPVAAGFALFACLVTMLASLVADVLYAVVDPRVRLY